MKMTLLDVVDEPEFVLPASSGSGNVGLIVGAVIVLIVIIVAVILIRKKKK